MTIFRPGDDAARKTVARFSVEIAADSRSIRSGLSGREGMPDDRGMLFLLGDGKYSFWMTGMRYPLDIVIFGRDKRTVDIVRELQLCERCPLIEMPDGAAYVLEINAGLAERLGIKVGDVFVLEEEETFKVPPLGGSPGRQSSRFDVQVSDWLIKTVQGVERGTLNAGLFYGLR